MGGKWGVNGGYVGGIWGSYEGYVGLNSPPALPPCAAWRSTPYRKRCVQGLTLVPFSAQRKHNSFGTSFSPRLLDRGTRGGVTKTAQVGLKSGRV